MSTPQETSVMHARSRSHSLSTAIPPTSPLPLSSALSPASLRFSELALSPPTTLQSEEFKRAYHHARSASFSTGSAPVGLGLAPSQTGGIGINTDVASWAAGLSTSPSTTASSSSGGDDRLLTPSSSPTILQQPLTTPPASTKASSNSGRASSLKGSEGVIHEDDELSDGVQIVNPPASSTIYSNGARWGWPQAQQMTQTSASVGSGAGLGVSGGGSPPPSPSRRASLGLGPPPDGRTTYGMTAPLGRVVSAGATMGSASSSSSGGKSEPFGLFRRLSVGGFGNKVRSPFSPTFLPSLLQC
ncbi:hypothetical protein RQP46_006947 [Phenoliferia psychrophenolica]